MRLVLVGGAISFRALFSWLTPWIYVPVLLVFPTLEIVFFVYVGRAARLEDDTFYVIGSGLLAVAVPCLFAMSQTIGSERRFQTLPFLLSSPARRGPVFLGRSLPVVVNGFVVAAVALLASSLLFDVRLGAEAWSGVAVCVAAAAVSATALGVVCGAAALLGRDATVLANVLTVGLLLFCGATIPRGSLPEWMRVVGDGVPLTHAIEAAREAAAGATLARYGTLLLVELAVAAAYAALGFLLVRRLETSARRRATLELL